MGVSKDQGPSRSSEDNLGGGGLPLEADSSAPTLPETAVFCAEDIKMAITQSDNNTLKELLPSIGDAFTYTTNYSDYAKKSGLRPLIVKRDSSFRLKRTSAGFSLGAATNVVLEAAFTQHIPYFRAGSLPTKLVGSSAFSIYNTLAYQIKLENEGINIKEIEDCLIVYYKSKEEELNQNLTVDSESS